jgi:hypothetical protein
MKRELNVYDYLFYLSLLVILIWLILKSFGIIQTPFWLEYGVPIGGFAIAVLTLYQNLLEKIGKLAINLSVLNTKFSHLEKDVGVLKEDMGLLKTDVSTLKIDVEILKRK